MAFNSTKLVCVPIGSCISAPAELGRLRISRGTKLSPVAFFPSRCPCFLWEVIPKGFVALVNRHGKHVGIWGPGYHYASPWISISHLIPVQYTVYDTPVKECPTQDNVMVTIDVTLIFRVMCENPKSLYKFCYRLGADKLDKMLHAFQEEAIREMVRKRKYNEIYDLMEDAHDRQLDATKRTLNDHFQEYGVEITSLAVTNVHLPKEFADNMQEESIWGTRDEFNKLEQKFSLQKIEIKEKEAKEKQKANENLAKYCAQKDTEMAQQMQKKKLVLAETDKAIAEIAEQEKADVLRIDSNSKLVVANINKERDIRLSKIRMEGRSESEKIRIESKTYVSMKDAEAQKVIVENQAKCMALNADAEKDAIPLLASKREYEKKMRSLQSMRALSLNESICIAGNHKDNIVAQLVANSKQANVFGVNVN